MKFAHVKKLCAARMADVVQSEIDVGGFREAVQSEFPEITDEQIERALLEFQAQFERKAGL